MSKLPAFQFYPGDWLKDPALRKCSAAARGIWMDLLCLMFESEQRGKLVTNGVTWTLQDAARAISGDTNENLSLINELIRNGVARVDSDGAIYSKRLIEDEIKRNQTKTRVSKFRSRNAFSNADVTHDVTPKYEDEDEDEVRKSFEVEVPPDNLDELTEDIGHLHPANSHLKGKFLPENQKYEIAEAIKRDGVDLIRAGTENYRDAVRAWPKSEHRFITNPVKFYRESEYLKDPQTWERTNEQSKPGPQTVNLARAGAGIVRAINNVSAAQTAIQILRDRRNGGGSDGGNPTGEPD